MRQEGEPSVDQILRSIKRVMAREPRSIRSDEPEASGAAEDLVMPEPAEAEEAQELIELSGSGAGAEPIASDALMAQGDLDGFDGQALEDEPFQEGLVEGEALEPDDLIENEADGEAEAPASPASSEPADELANEQGSAPAQLAEAQGQLTSEGVAASMRQSLAALAMLAEPGAPLPTSAAGAASLDSLVREMLRPMLAQWLEANLPSIVEREVRVEITRITSGNTGGKTG